MSRVFCPDYGSLSVNGGYRAMFTLYKDEPMKLVPFKDGPKYFPTATAARNAAKDWVSEKLNTIRGSNGDQDEDILGIEDWRRERAEQAEQEKAAVFGREGPGIIFIKGGRQVVVERRKRA